VSDDDLFTLHGSMRGVSLQSEHPPLDEAGRDRHTVCANFFWGEREIGMGVGDVIGVTPGEAWMGLRRGGAGLCRAITPGVVR